MFKRFSVVLAVLMLAQTAVAEQSMTQSVRKLSMETALTAAKAAIDACRKEGVQIAVTVVDRGGHTQVVLRDVLAPDLTLRISYQKAYTAMSFNAKLSSMEGRFKDPFSIGKVDGLVFSAGGVPIQAAGTWFGGIGVSGAPSGKTDEKCAQAGADAIVPELEMEN